MDIRVTHFCLLTEFLDVDFNSSIVSESLVPKIENVMVQNRLHIPDGWALVFQANYNNGRVPLVSRNKLGGYRADQMKYITILIPIPLISEIAWGVNPDQHLYKRDHYEKLMRNFIELNIDYHDFSNRSDYIIACLKAGIKMAFETGFTVGSSKLKVKIPIEL